MSRQRKQEAFQRAPVDYSNLQSGVELEYDHWGDSSDESDNEDRPREGARPPMPTVKPVDVVNAPGNFYILLFVIHYIIIVIIIFFYKFWCIVKCVVYNLIVFRWDRVDWTHACDRSLQWSSCRRGADATACTAQAPEYDGVDTHLHCASLPKLHTSLTCAQSKHWRQHAWSSRSCFSGTSWRTPVLGRLIYIY